MAGLTWWATARIRAAVGFVPEALAGKSVRAGRNAQPSIDRPPSLHTHYRRKMRPPEAKTADKLRAVPSLWLASALLAKDRRNSLCKNAKVLR